MQSLSVGGFPNLQSTFIHPFTSIHQMLNVSQIILTSYKHLMTVSMCVCVRGVFVCTVTP